MGNLNYPASPICNCDWLANFTTESADFWHYRCSHCDRFFVISKHPRKDLKMKYIVTRDDNNRQFESEKQAILVAEKLAAENPSHIYYVGKLIKESKVNSVTTIDLE